MSVCGLWWIVKLPILLLLLSVLCRVVACHKAHAVAPTYTWAINSATCYPMVLGMVWGLVAATSSHLNNIAKNMQRSLYRSHACMYVCARVCMCVCLVCIVRVPTMCVCVRVLCVCPWTLLVWFWVSRHSVVVSPCGDVPESVLTDCCVFCCVDPPSVHLIWICVDACICAIAMASVIAWSWLV